MESQEKEGGDDQDNLEKVGAFAKQSTGDSGGFVSPSGRNLAASVAVSVSQHCRLNIQTSNITDQCLNMRGKGWVQMQTEDILFDLTIAS